MEPNEFFGACFVIIGLFMIGTALWIQWKHTRKNVVYETIVIKKE
jgi:hypothetical protein